MSDDRSQEYQDRIYALYDEWSVDPATFWANHPEFDGLHEGWGSPDDPENQQIDPRTDAIETIAKHVTWNTGYSFSSVDSGVPTRPGIRVYKKAGRLGRRPAKIRS